MYHFEVLNSFGVFFSKAFSVIVFCWSRFWPFTSRFLGLVIQPFHLREDGIFRHAKIAWECQFTIRRPWESQVLVELDLKSPSYTSHNSGGNWGAWNEIIFCLIPGYLDGSSRWVLDSWGFSALVALVMHLDAGVAPTSGKFLALSALSSIFMIFGDL